MRLFLCGSWKQAAGYQATRKLLAVHRPTALFCMNDATAIGSIRALRETGLRVPQDVSVVGFDDGEAAEFSWPALTTVRQPRQQMGKEGAQELLRLMSAQGSSGISRVLEVQLIVRGSTCPVP
jgi:DNA-binding LacI/PurR family transcriptional regulator